MKLKDLAQNINISLESLQNFIFDFNIDISRCVDEKLEVTDKFQKFAKDNKEFLQLYNEDHGKEKTVKDIAQTLKIDEKEILNFFKENGLPNIDPNNFKTTVSSFLIHIYIGGNYDFITKAFPNAIHVTDRALIGYADLFFYVTDLLDPFINEDQIKEWGILRPTGIILYGPPGSGKIFWANKIANIIGYEFVHVYKDYLSVSAEASSKNQFNKFLMEKMKQPKTLLFIENFDELMHKSKDKMYIPEAMELINAILRHIQKNVHQEIVIVGSAEILSLINDDVVAPGRFDLQIPVFPPTEDERAELILFHMMQHLTHESPLCKILEKNNAHDKPFWEPLASQMKLFSNTMIIDFTQSLKKRIYAIYRKDENKDIQLTEQLLLAAFMEAKAKLNSSYLKRCAAFIMEAKQNVGTEFPHRILELESEFDFYKVKQEPIRQIGFKADEKETGLHETSEISEDFKEKESN
ncbi:AAA family ATPase [Paenimyroides ceti]